MKRADVMPGSRFGRWTVVAEHPGKLSVTTSRPSGERAVLVRCDCGQQQVVRLAPLRRGVATSCGCRRREVTGARRRQHGATVGAKHSSMQRTPLYRLWAGIKARCYNPKDISFKNYGARGITMWSGWAASYECFETDILASIGPHPGKSWSIDRINNDLGYVPGNLRWATRSQQQRNKRRPR